ncbi:MAG: sigma-70 family RNA polymerase sigma factor [Glaciihabitans sp.]
MFDRHAPAVTRYAWALAGTRSDAAELVQDTFVTVWRNAGRIAIEASALPWLLVTCRNHGRNLARKRAREHATTLPDELVASPDDEDAKQELRWVIAEIERLEPIDQRVCQLCLVEGRPYKDVAEILGITVGAVKQRVSRARTRLRKAVLDNEN